MQIFSNVFSRFELKSASSHFHLVNPRFPGCCPKRQSFLLFFFQFLVSFILIFVPIQAYDTLLSLPPILSANDGSFRRLNALVEGLAECERRQCDRTVGFGGSPDEKGETTLDSLVMDGPGHKSGRIKSAAKVAWAVMNYTEHSLLVGEKATQFALAMGFKEESLETSESREMHEEWLRANCQPNFWKNVHPDPNTHCGPYQPDWPQFASPNPSWKSVLFDQTETLARFKMPSFTKWNRAIFDGANHDTIGMILIDEGRNVSAGTSSNGARNKIPGRVGDSPIVGSGAFLDNQVGGAAATGDGDIMMRFGPSFLAVELMRQGKSPSEATTEAIGRIKKFYPKFSGAIIAANIQGNFGAACAGMEKFGYSVVSPKTKREVKVEWIRC